MKEFSKLLKNKNFMALWGSAIFSQLAINMLSFLILTRIFEKTNSTIATSFVWVAYALPAVIFGPFGAVTADVFSRKKIMMVTNMSQAIVVLLFAILYQQYFYLAYGVVFLYALFNQFYVPAEAATLPSLVKKSVLPAANGILFITVQSGLTLGFVSAGILYDILGFGISVAICVPLLFVAFACLMRLPKRRVGEHIPKEFEKGVRRFFEELFEGYAFIRQNATIFVPFMLLIGLQISLSVLVILMPELAKDILLVKASLASVIVVLPAAGGALIGTILVNRLLARHMRKKELIGMSLFILSLAILTVGALVPILPFWIGRTAAVICFALCGLAYVGTLIPSLTYLQEHTPQALMGRVFGNIWFITAAATVMPVLFAATISELFGVGLVLTLVSFIGFASVFFLRYQEQIENVFRLLKKK